MLRLLEPLLLDADLDLSLSAIDRTDPQRLRIISRPGPVRIAFSLLFAIPCALLLHFGVQQGGYYLTLPVLFCPVLALLATLLGFAVQEKTFHPTAHEAILAYQLLFRKHRRVYMLPKHGALVLTRRTSVGETSSHYYEVHIEGLDGFGFTIANDEKRRDNFARELATFLDFAIRKV